MFENYHAVKIQNFYKKFIKVERDYDDCFKFKKNITYQTKKGLTKTKKITVKIPKPIDPLYRIPFQEKHLIRLTEYNKKYAVFYFNISTLIKWLNQCREWTNPLTNCPFRNTSRKRIVDFCQKIKTPVLRLKYKRNHLEPEPLEQNDFETKLVKYIDNKDVYRLNKLMNLGLSQIQTKKLTLDFKVKSNIYNELTKEYLTDIYLIHYTILKGNYSIFSMLFNYFEEIDCLTYPGYFTPIHLCAFNNQPSMALKLKDGGCNLNAVCSFQDQEDVSIFEICDLLGNQNFINYLFNH